MLRRLALVVALALAALSGCKKKPAGGKSATAIAGLGAVPADAESVISFDVGRLIDAPLVDRAVQLLLQRNQGLADRWTKVAASCQIDVRKQIHRVLIAFGPEVNGGAGAVLTVLSAEIPEAKLATCLRQVVGTGAGEVTAHTSAGRTIYTVKDAGRVVYYGYGQADTIVLGTSQAWVETALASSGPKATDSGALKPLLARADQAAPIWAAGRPPRVSDGLIKLTGGAMKKGPQAFFLSVDPTTGLRLELGAELTSEDDAKVLEEFAKSQLPFLAMAAQIKALGPLVSKIAVARTGAVCTAKVSLSMEEVNDLMRVIDRPGADPQDSAPATDAAVPPAVDAAVAPRK